MPSSDELMSRSNKSHRPSRVKSYQGTRCVGTRRQWSAAVKIADKSSREEGKCSSSGLAAAELLALFEGARCATARWYRSQMTVEGRLPGRATCSRECIPASGLKI